MNKRKATSSNAGCDEFSNKDDGLINLNILRGPSYL
jgi:hypothetical protein